MADDLTEQIADVARREMSDPEEMGPVVAGVMAIVGPELEGLEGVVTDLGVVRLERQAEVERLRAIITSLDCATAERDAAIRRRDQAENRAALYRHQIADLKAHRDALIDEVKTLQHDLEAFREAQKAWVQFRRDRDALKAATDRVRARLDELNGGASVAADLDLLDPSDLELVRHVASKILAALDQPTDTGVDLNVTNDIQASGTVPERRPTPTDTAGETDG